MAHPRERLMSRVARAFGRLSWAGAVVTAIALTFPWLPGERVPGAAWAQSGPYEGFGAGTPGGSREAVVRVTTLADAGPGSLRDAVSLGWRTVVFDVAGTIDLASAIHVGGPFVTIDGFTAPAPGITLRGGGLIVRGRDGAHDVIIRGLRVRDAAEDGIQIAYGAYNVVV